MLPETNINFRAQWLDSDLIPRLLEIFEILKIFVIILLSAKNGAYRRVSGP